MWRGCSGKCNSSSESNNLIEKLNGHILDVGGTKLKLKKLTIASVVADFAARGEQWWPLNVSVSLRKRMSSCERGQHNSQEQAHNHIKSWQPTICIVLAVAVLALMM